MIFDHENEKTKFTDHFTHLRKDPTIMKLHTALLGLALIAAVPAAGQDAWQLDR
jgi:hypothetical protein